jgi:hypothetical protein
VTAYGQGDLLCVVLGGGVVGAAIGLFLVLAVWS